MGQFLSDDEIVADILSVLDNNPDSVDDWLSVPFDDLIQLHHSTGMHIRNYYKMWEEGNTYSNEKDAQADDFPDQRSQRVIEKVWRTLQERREKVES